MSNFDEFNDFNEAEDFDNEIFQAIEKFEDMLSNKSNYYFDIFEFEDIINFYLDNENRKKAAIAINIAGKQHPAAPEIKFAKARLLFEDNNNIEALKMLHEAEKIDGSNPDIYVLKGTCYLRLKNFKEAELAFKKALRFAFDDKLNFYLAIGAAYTDNGLHKKASEYLTYAEKKYPHNTELLNEIALIYERRGLHQKSIEYYHKTLDINPFSALAWYNVGILRNITEEYDLAIEAFDFVLAIDEDFDLAYYNRGNSYLGKEDFKAALEDFNVFKKIYDDNEYVYYLIGICWENLEAYNTAGFYFKKAIDIDPDFPDAYYGLGSMNIFNKEYDEAVKNLKEAVKLDYNNPEYTFALATAYKNTGNDVYAVFNFKRALSKAPHEEDYYLEFAYFYFEKNKFEKAYKIIQTGLQQADRKSGLLMVAAAFLINNGYSYDAIQTIKQATERKDYEKDNIKDFYKFAEKEFITPRIKRIIELYEKRGN